MRGAAAVSIEMAIELRLHERAQGLRRLLEARFYHRPRRIHPNDRDAIEAAIRAELEAAVAEALKAVRH